MVPGQAQYSSAWHGMATVVRTQGPSGLLRGYWATNAVWIPWNMLYIAMYEDLKRRARRSLALETDDPLPAAVTAATSLIAASAAAVVTHPADIIKTRLQVLLHFLPWHLCMQHAIDCRHHDVVDLCRC